MDEGWVVFIFVLRFFSFLFTVSFLVFAVRVSVELHFASCMAAGVVRLTSQWSCDALLLLFLFFCFFLIPKYLDDGTTRKGKRRNHQRPVVPRERIGAKRRPAFA